MTGTIVVDCPEGSLRDAMLEVLDAEGYKVVTPSDESSAAVDGLVVVAEVLEASSFATYAATVFEGIEQSLVDVRSRLVPGGSIVLVAPPLGAEVRVGLAGASLVQRGVLGLARGLAVSLGEDGVRVNAVLPGVLNDVEAPAAMIPLRQPGASDRRGLPKDVADAVEFLLSDDAAYVTGTELVVDGGLSQCRSSATFALWDAGLIDAFNPLTEGKI